MFNEFRKTQYELYDKARKHFVSNYEQLIELEKYFFSVLYKTLVNSLDEIVRDYNEASYLYPFWQNYPPDDRGRRPKGDQFPWIEVGEHSLGCKLPRLLGKHFEIRDIGLPTGPDQRLVVKDDNISKVTEKFTDSCWLFIDVKSVGPRDDQDHTVMSHNQVSGRGEWTEFEKGVENKIIQAKGKRTSHPFYCSIPPIYVLSDGKILPVILLVVKPVYKMLSLNGNSKQRGQPLNRITVVSIPNGLLLEEKPNYLKKYPSLFFPGKDDKDKNANKVR